MSRLKKALKWQLIANIMQASFGGAFLLILSKYLGAEKFGLYSVVTAAAALIYGLFDFRLQDIALRVITIAESKKNSDLNLAVSSLIFFEIVTKSILIAGVVLYLKFILGDMSDVLLYAFAIFGYTFSKILNGVSIALLRFIGRVDVISKFVTIEWGLKLLLLFAFIIFDSDNLKVLLLFMGLIGILINISQVKFTFKISNVNPGGSVINFSNFIIFHEENKNLIYSGLGISITDLMSKDLDINLMSSIISYQKIGLYKLAKTFVQLIWRAIDPVYFALMPEVQNLVINNQRKQLKILIKKSMLYMLIFSIVLVVLGGVGLLLVQKYFLGSEYDGVLNLYLIVSLWVIICAPLLWAHPLAVAVDSNILSVIAGLLGSIIGIVVLYSTIHEFDVFGAGFSWVTTLSVTFVFQAIFVYRKFNNEQK